MEWWLKFVIVGVAVVVSACIYAIGYYGQKFFHELLVMEGKIKKT